MTSENLNQESPSSNFEKAWENCLVTETPLLVKSRESDAAHPLERACTEEEYLDSLVITIEKNILPIIVEQHLETSIPEVLKELPIDLINEKSIAELTQLVLQEDAGTSANYVKEMNASGVSLENIYLLLLTPVARNLGEMWDEDGVSFTDVTIALWRIKQLMYDLSPLFQQYAQSNKTGSSIILVPLPGSQHNLGLFMVSEFFAKAGWRIWGELAATQQDIVSMAQTEWFDVIGLSVSLREQFPQLKELIKEIKLKSKNPQLGVMIGSPVFNQFPELVDDIGADMVGFSAEDALEKATYYVQRLR